MVVQSTIGGTTPDYTTTIAWEADKQGTLTDVQEGLLRDVADAGGLVIDGSTTDASNFFRLTYDSGAQTDYTRGSGARLISAGSGHVIQVGDAFTELVGLEVSNTSGANSDEGIRLLAGADNLLIDGCFIYDMNDNAEQDGIYIADTDVSNIRVQNTVIIDCNRGGIMIQASDLGNTSWKIYNCIILKCGASTTLTHGGGIIWQGDSGATIDWAIVNTTSMTSETNAIDYGEAQVAQITPTTTGSNNNADSDATMPQGGGPNQQSRTLTDDGSPGAGDWIIITTNTAGSEDVHLQDVAENDATTNGVGPATDGDVPTSDFDGNTRAGTTCDIGPHEVTSAGEHLAQTAPETLVIATFNGTVKHNQTLTQPAVETLELATLNGTVAAGQLLSQSAVETLELATFNGTVSAAQSLSQNAVETLTLVTFNGTVKANQSLTQSAPETLTIATFNGTVNAKQQVAQPAVETLVIATFNGAVISGAAGEHITQNAVQALVLVTFSGTVADSAAVFETPLAVDAESVVVLVSVSELVPIVGHDSALILVLSTEVTAVTKKGIVFDDYIVGDSKEITFTAVNSAGAAINISAATNIDFALRTPARTFKIVGVPENLPAVGFRDTGTDGQYFIRLETGDFTDADVGVAEFETSVTVAGDDTTGAIGTFRIRATII